MVPRDIGRGLKRGKEGEEERERGRGGVKEKDGLCVCERERDSPPLPRIPEIAILLMPGVRTREDREGEVKVCVRSRRERV